MNPLDIKGEYTFKIPITTMFFNRYFEIKNTNLVTFYGESFFLNRMINNTFDPIQYICLGDAPIRPNKKDTSLGNETIRKSCTKTVDLTKKQIVLETSFDIREVYGTSEIGVATDTILISHDNYTPITDEFLPSLNVGEIEVEYTFTIRTGAYKTGWSETNLDGVYYAPELNKVASVFESNGTGYSKVNRKSDLTRITDTPAFYYDIINKNIYIKPGDGNHPDYKEIILQTE